MKCGKKKPNAIRPCLDICQSGVFWSVIGGGEEDWRCVCAVSQSAASKHGVVPAHRKSITTPTDTPVIMIQDM